MPFFQMELFDLKQTSTSVLDRIGCVTVGVLVWSAVDRGFEPSLV